MEVILSFLAGFIAAIAVVFIVFRIKIFGYLKMDTSESVERPYIYMELKKQPALLYKKRYVVLKVSDDSVSHK